MTRYPPIPEKLKDRLDRVTPSHDRGITYYPCSVTLDDGSELERVYIVEYEPYILIWGITPPPGLTASATRKVFPHTGKDTSPQEGPDYVWCLYQGASGATHVNGFAPSHR